MRSQLPDIREKIGFLPERVRGYGWMTVAEHLAFLSTFFPTWDHEYARELLRRLDLPPGSKVGTLSKGMGVKLSMVAAEAHRPSVLVLDEPTSAIDPLMRGQILAIVDESVPKDGDRLVLFSSHILEDVEKIADRVVLIRCGRLVVDESVEELQRRDPDNTLSRILYAVLESRDVTKIS